MFDVAVAFIQNIVSSGRKVDELVKSWKVFPEIRAVKLSKNNIGSIRGGVLMAADHVMQLLKSSSLIR